MNKVTEESVAAFLTNSEYSNGSTAVVPGVLFTYIRLHGHNIARRSGLNGEIHISNAGFETRVTQSRLNGLLKRLGRSGIYSRDSVWYWEGETGEVEFPRDTWVRVK